MAPATLVRYAQEALMLAMATSLPVVAVAALVGLLVAAFQAASQVQDPTLTHLPRLVAVALVLVALASWMGHQVAVFAERMFVFAAR